LVEAAVLEESADLLNKVDILVVLWSCSSSLLLAGRGGEEER
jgi:hypothetical protein